MRCVPVTACSTASKKPRTSCCGLRSPTHADEGGSGHARGQERLHRFVGGPRRAPSSQYFVEQFASREPLVEVGEAVVPQGVVDQLDQCPPLHVGLDTQCHRVMTSAGARPLRARPVIWQSGVGEESPAWHALAVTDRFVVAVDLTITDAKRMKTFASVVRFMEVADVQAMSQDIEAGVTLRFGSRDPHAQEPFGIMRGPAIRLRGIGAHSVNGCIRT